MVDLAAINRKHFVFLNKIVSFVACVIARDVRLSRVDRQTDRETERERQTERQRQTDRQTYKPTTVTPWRMRAES